MTEADLTDQIVIALKFAVVTKEASNMKHTHELLEDNGVQVLDLWVGIEQFKLRQQS